MVPETHNKTGVTGYTRKKRVDTTDQVTFSLFKQQKMAKNKKTKKKETDLKYWPTFDLWAYPMQKDNKEAFQKLP